MHISDIFSKPINIFNVFIISNVISNLSEFDSHVA